LLCANNATNLYNQVRNKSDASNKFDTMPDATLTCGQKLTRVSLICRTEPTTEKWKTEKLKTDVLRSIGKQSAGNPWRVSPEEEKEGYGGNDLQKRKVLSLE